MKARSITIAVYDIKKSIDFLINGLGFTNNSIQNIDDNQCVFNLDNNFSLILNNKQKHSENTSTPNQTQKNIDFKLSRDTNSKEQFDKIFNSAIELGATVIEQPIENTWGYTTVIIDPDGHQWEISYLYD